MRCSAADGTRRAEESGVQTRELFLDLPKPNKAERRYLLTLIRAMQDQIQVAELWLGELRFCEANLRQFYIEKQKSKTC
jgi:hypothetical protein